MTSSSTECQHPSVDTAAEILIVAGHLASTGTQVEIELRATIPRPGRLRLDLLVTPDGEESTTLELRRDRDGKLAINLDRSRSSLDAEVDRSSHSGDLPLLQCNTGDTCMVRVFLDRSSIEVFVDGVALTTRVYPTRTDADCIRLVAEGDVRVDDVRGWRLLDQEQNFRVMEPPLDSEM